MTDPQDDFEITGVARVFTRQVSAGQQYAGNFIPPLRANVMEIRPDNGGPLVRFEGTASYYPEPGPVPKEITGHRVVVRQRAEGSVVTTTVLDIDTGKTYTTRYHR